MKTPCTILVLLLSLAANGCYTARDTLDDLSISCRNHALARRAWHQSGWERVNLPHVEHFQDGFIAGYADVASGKSGCLPALPPRRYWDPSSLDAAGRQTSLAWYDGYAQGAECAQEDGVRGWSRLDGVEQAAHQRWNDLVAGGDLPGEVRAGTVQPLPPVEDAFQHAPFSAQAQPPVSVPDPASG
jgi:hypothetical protein